jgi:hypothetical protein
VSKTGRAYGPAQSTISASQGRYDELVWNAQAATHAAQLNEEVDESWKAFYQTYRTRPNARRTF